MVWLPESYTEVTIPTAAELSAVSTDVGNKANLTTTAKTNLVAAINEVDGECSDLKSALSEPTKNLNTAAVGYFKANTLGEIVPTGNTKNFGMIDKIQCSPTTVYTLSYYDVTFGGDPSVYVSYYDSSGDFIETVNEGNASNKAITITTPSTAYYMHVYFYRNDTNTYGDNVGIQIELGSVKTDYVPPIQPKGMNEMDDEISSLKDNIFKKEYDISRWSSGTINASSGLDDLTSTIRIKTELLNDVYSVIPINGYSILVYAYNNGTYIGNWNGTTFIQSTHGNVWFNSEIVFSNINPAYQYRIVAKNISGDSISVQDSINILFRISDDSVLKQDVEALENHSETKYGTPYHDVEDEFADTIAQDIDAKTIVIGIVTDTHYTTGNPNSDYGKYQLKYARAFKTICERIGVDFAIHLGDLIDSDYDDIYHQEGEYPDKSRADITVNIKRIGEMMNAYQTYVPFMYCIAHHERKPFMQNNTQTNTAVYKLSREIVHGICNKYGRYVDFVHFADDPTSSSYYADFADRKIRIINVDSTDNTQVGFTPSDATFLLNSISSMPSGYKAVIFTHCPFLGEAMLSGEAPAYWDQIKTTITSSSYQGKVLAYISGHCHADNIITPTMMVQGDATYTYDFPLITIDAQKMDVRSIISPISGITLGDAYRNIRQYYTVSEYLFDVACIHVDTGIINLHRFGAGQYKTRTYDSNTGQASFTAWSNS